MAKMLVRPNLSYKSLIMDAKDFVALTEILDRSTVIDHRWKNDKNYLVIDEEQCLPEANMFKGKAITIAEYNQIAEEQS